ncbi:hypothetical protein D3C85_396380 [compost metagenome]
MTNAIEQTRISMYDAFNAMKAGGRWLIKKANCEAFETALEEHLEELDRQAKHLMSKGVCGLIFGSAHQWSVSGNFDSVKAVERLIAEKDDLALRLSAMTQERDDIQSRLHAIDHAYCEQSNRVSVMDKMIDNLRTASAAAGEELIRVQGIARQHLDDCRSAEKLSDELSEKLTLATSVIGQQEMLIAGQRHAIAELYMERAGLKKSKCMHSFHHQHGHCIYCAERQ